MPPCFLWSSSAGLLAGTTDPLGHRPAERLTALWSRGPLALTGPMGRRLIARNIQKRCGTLQSEWTLDLAPFPCERFQRIRRILSQRRRSVSGALN
jgi:hypothetical protein